MSEFLDLVLGFPTVFLTAALAIVTIYWAFVIFGALDVDTFDFDVDLDGIAEGAAEGALEGAAEGAAEGAIEGGLEGGLEGAEGALEGAEGALEGAEGALEGADGALEGAEGAAEGAEAGVHEGLSFIGFLSTLGLRRAPFTVTLSLLTLAAWAFCVLGMQYLAPVLTMLPGFVVGGGVMLGSLVLAVPVTSVTSRPLGPLFITHEADKRADFIGRTCRIDTGSVDGKFGQATVAEGGGWTVIQVRAANDNDLRRGDEALIVAYDNQLEAFRVESMKVESKEAEGSSAARRAAQTVKDAR